MKPSAHPRTAEAGPLLERLAFVQEAIAAAAALRAGAELGVLSRLDEKPVDPATLARERGISERGARLLLAALAGMGLAEVTATGEYAAALTGLDTIAPWLDQWSQLTEAVRSDRPVVRGDTPSGAEALYPRAVDQLGVLFAGAAAAVADRLAAPGLTILDVGAGAAPWSLALAARHADCRVTAVDLPGVLGNTRRAVKGAGLEPQFKYMAGDFFSTDFGRARYDLIVAGNICHLFDDRSNRALLTRLFDALRPGGCVAILEEVPTEVMDGPRAVVLYALGLLLLSGSGRIYPFSTYAGWLRDSGFEAISQAEPDPSQLISLITARRPAHE
jgi:2-polyprenyl-3-methyl-5-hydroxy-6-metoxy-1,4-benzoquinol methylase